MNDNILFKFPGGFTIRHISPEDVEAVHSLEREGSPSPWSIGIFYDCIRVGYQCLALCAPNGDVIGFTITRVKAGEAHIFNVVVQKAYQGQGLGTQFLNAIIERSISLDAEEIMLEVRSTNSRAIYLYEKLGFVKVGLREGYYPGDPPEDAVLYTLKV